MGMPGPWGTVKDRRFETEVPGAKRRCRITDEVTNVPYYNMKKTSYMRRFFRSAKYADSEKQSHINQKFMQKVCDETV